MSDNGHGLPYRPCVGLMVLNNENKVWIGRRVMEANTEYSGSSKRWQLPQGGIDKDEDPAVASLRELFEETGIRSVTPIAHTADWLTYDLPIHLMRIGLRGKYRGQKQMWYVYRFEGDESEIAINPPPDGHKAEFDDWRWEELAKLPELIIEFKRPIYEELVRRFSYLTEGN